MINFRAGNNFLMILTAIVWISLQNCDINYTECIFFIYMHTAISQD